jgi:hypothetical protein
MRHQLIATKADAILQRSARQSASRPRQGNNAHLIGFCMFDEPLFCPLQADYGRHKKGGPRDPI